MGSLNMTEPNHPSPDQTVVLSGYTKTLINRLKAIKPKLKVEEASRITVSKTASFFAFVYEKIRNAIEYREEQLIRRAAIERIIKRRLALNPEGRGEGENIVRELLWARYFPEDSLSFEDVAKVQAIIDRYQLIKNRLLIGRNAGDRAYLIQFLIDFLTCQIEETLSPDKATQKRQYTYFVYQILRNKIKIKDVSETKQNAYFYAATEKAFSRSDRPYLRYHIFQLSYKSFDQYSQSEIDALIPQLPSIFRKIDEIINNPYNDKLLRFVRRQIPPFLILFEIFNRHPDNIEQLLTDKKKLWREVEGVCREKYAFVNKRLQQTAIRSLIYIFLTKMILAIILEFPLSQYLYGEVNFLSIGINTLFPPFLMLLIIGFVKAPGEKNTQRIFFRIIDIVDQNKNFENSVALISKKPKPKRPILVFGFTIFYSLTFIVTISLIHAGLSKLHFNLISEGIFIFFISVVSFFGYRVRQIAKEYKLSQKTSFFSPFVDFFFMPILSLGKFFSNEVARLNFFIAFFDFLIEAPFKLIIEIFEEWISFVKEKKEEII